MTRARGGAALLLVLGVALGAHAAALALRTHGREARPLAVTPGPMLASTTSTIDEVAMQLHVMGPGDPSPPVLADVVDALDPRTRVRLVVGDARDERIFRDALAQRHVDAARVTFVSAGRPITSWSRDRMTVLGPPRPGMPTTLVAPPHAVRGPEPRVNDWRTPWLLRDSLGDAARVTVAPFTFDGGDLIADEQHVFVATPLFERNPGVASGTVMHELRALGGRPLVRLGDDDHPSPEHHVCMFLTPLGHGRVAVADPELGLALLGSTRRLRVGGAPLDVDDSADTRARFRVVADALAARGYDVVHVPVVPSTTPYVWMSWNNALVDVRDGTTHVVMPTYGVPELDAAARAAFERAGCVVHEVRVDALFRQGGSVRCVVEPLSMRPAAS